MEFEIKSYLEMNLIVDLLLLLVFSFTVLLRNPKFLLFLCALNFCQYVIWVPDKEILEAHQKIKAQELKRAALQDDQPSKTEDLGLGQSVQIPGEAIKIYDRVLEGVGMGEGAASSAVEISLGAWKKNLLFSEKQNEGGFSLNLTSVLLQAASGDMYAAWFVIRLFWLAATFYLYVQRPQIGTTVFALNLLPIPFLANFLPYLWFRFNEQKWVQDLNIWAQAGGLPEDMIHFFVYHTVAFFVLALPLFLVIIAARIQWSKRRDSGLRSYLDPSRYDLLINGSRIPFTFNGNILVAGDFNLNIQQLSYNPENPHIWYLKTGTKVEFSERINNND
jgi:hypothetical protein